MFDTTHVSAADLVDEQREREELDAYFEGLDVPEEATWGFGPEPYEPSPYDGTYSEM